MIGYFEVRAWVPLLAYVAYLLIGKRLGRNFVIIGVGSYLLAIFTLIVGMKTGIPLSSVVGAKLSYESAVEGMTFGTLIVSTLWMRTRDAGLSLVSSILCLSAVGWLYEVPFWHPVSMFIHPIGATSPLIVDTQIISLLLLTFTLWRRGWRPGKLFAATLIIYLISSVYLAIIGGTYYYQFLYPVRDWIIRLPSYGLLLSMVHGTLRRRGETRRTLYESEQPDTIPPR